MTRLARWGILLALLGAHQELHAAVPNAERIRTAAEEFDAGRRAYKVRDFEGAAVHFENADRDAPSADALLAAIRSRREAGQLARAATLAAAGLVRYPNDKALDEYATQVLTDADRAKQKVMVGCSPACTLLLDGRLVPSEQAVRTTLYVDEGPHTIVAGWSADRRASRDFVAVAGGSTGLDLVPPPTGASPSLVPPPGESSSGVVARVDVEAKPEDASRSGLLSPTAFWAGVGTTSVLGILTVVSGLDAVNHPGTDAVRTACQKDNTSTECHSLYDDGRSAQTRTNVLLAATGGAAAVTAVLGIFFTRWSDHASATGAALTPAVSVSQGVTVGAVGRF